MKFKFGTQWLEDRTQVTQMLESVITETGRADQYFKHLSKGTVLFEEGGPLHHIYILLEGVVELFKKKPNTDQYFSITRLQSGSLIGIISYTTGKASLTKAIATEPCKVLKIPENEIKELIEQNSEIQTYFDELILANLLERYRRNIILQMKLDSVNALLREERNQVRQAYQELKEAQNKLILQEKMATLGQLVAGFAHEVNNPTAALVRSTETLKSHIEKLIDQEDDSANQTKLGVQFYQAGRDTLYSDTSEIRKRIQSIKNTFPEIGASERRLLAQVPDSLLELIKKNDHTTKQIKFYISRFEMGRMFKNIDSAGTRIAGLVKSLKSYSRSDADQEWEEIDIREGIHDTLQLTSNRIKYYDLNLELDEVPAICANPAALNQVWTNLILNAADAMGKYGELSIQTSAIKDHIKIRIADNGPGIPEDIQDKIFEPNFTTKKSNEKFGLGLGLAISKNIIERHGGSITAENRPEGGALFTILIPKENGQRNDDQKNS